MIWLIIGFWEFGQVQEFGHDEGMEAYKHFASIFVTFSQSVWYPWFERYLSNTGHFYN